MHQLLDPTARLRRRFTAHSSSDLNGAALFLTRGGQHQFRELPVLVLPKIPGERSAIFREGLGNQPAIVAWVLDAWEHAAQLAFSKEMEFEALIPVRFLERVAISSKVGEAAFGVSIHKPAPIGGVLM